MKKKKKNLIIVESPAKANTIKKILGTNYEVTASNGHIRDLPKTKIGVDVENDFVASYKTIKGKGDVIKKLKEFAKKSDKIYLASDPDREGEAIAWHIAQVLKIDNDKIRIEFNEITKQAVKDSVKNPRKIDINRVNSQQTRRILDRLVGYKISPLLWELIDSNTSAGRVQSVALKMICELEDVIQKFVPEKFAEFEGEFEKKLIFKLYKVANNKVDKIKDDKLIAQIIKELSTKKEKKYIDKEKKQYKLVSKKEFEIIKTKVSNKEKKPPLPFKTSTLQQAASSKLSFSASKTMRVAQGLYEGIDINGVHMGLITYMRTDSNRISEEAKELTKKYIEEVYGKDYVGNYIQPKSKGKIQDAHEAIRPTDIVKTPDSLEKDLTKDQYKLYKLIYERFLISQFSNLKYEQMEIIAQFDKYQFRGITNKILFQGYYKIMKEEDEIITKDFPNINEKDKILLEFLKVREGETKPPARFNEASLVKKLESEGIGRPSTYAAIIETLKKREYTIVEKRVFYPTELGYEVKNILNEHFPNIMDIKFTAKLEEKLDDIEEGNEGFIKVLDEFYKDLYQYLEKLEKEVNRIREMKIFTDVPCEKCGKRMRVKTGRFGKYIECEDETCKSRISLPKSIKKINYDEKEIVKIRDIIEKDKLDKADKKTDVICEKCGKMIMVKIGRFGKYFGCIDTEECKNRFSMPKELKMADPIEENGLLLYSSRLEDIKEEEKRIIKEAGQCEKCGSEFVIKSGRFGKFLGCSNYPECKTIKKIPKKK